MKLLHGFIQTTRLIKSLGVVSILFLLLNSFTYGLGTLLFLLFSFAFNDFVDAEKDTIGHPHRAIPSGKITRKQGLIISLSLLIVGILWFMYFLYEYNVKFWMVYIGTTVYSYLLKPNLPILATFVHSSIVAIIFVQPFSTNLMIYVGVASIVYAYELLLDYRDRIADKQFCKTPTLPNMLGKGTWIISGLFFLTGVVVLIQHLV